MIKWEVRVSEGTGRRILSGIPRARTALAQAVLASCEPYVPYNTGELCRSGQAGEGIVTYTASHAARCYYSRRPFRKDKHPQACAQWFEAAKAVSLAEWRKKTALALGGKENGNA
ncbi:MAG: hypothetical protein IJ480_00380 [Clostridia bacterium]|nr:hypothetical protein [Clostridia bacterium]